MLYWLPKHSKAMQGLEIEIQSLFNVELTDYYWFQSEKYTNNYTKEL